MNSDDETRSNALGFSNFNKCFARNFNVDKDEIITGNNSLNKINADLLLDTNCSPEKNRVNVAVGNNGLNVDFISSVKKTSTDDLFEKGKIIFGFIKIINQLGKSFQDNEENLARNEKATMRKKHKKKVYESDEEQEKNQNYDEVRETNETYDNKYLNYLLN